MTGQAATERSEAMDLENLGIAIDRRGEVPIGVQIAWAIRARLGDGTLRWLPTEPDVLSFARGDEFACVVNLSDRAVPLPPHREVILSSAPVVEDNLLAADSAAWLRLQRNE